MAEKESPRLDYAVFIAQLNNGLSNEELTETLRDAVKRTQATGKPSVITHKIGVALVKGTTTITVADQISVKLPEFDRPSSVFFADDEGNLTRENPNQPALFTVADDKPRAVVELETPNAVVVDMTTGEIKETEND